MQVGEKNIKKCESDSDKANMSRRRLAALFSAIALMIAYSLTTTGLGFFIVPITRDLGYDRATFSLQFTIMTCISTLTALFVGRIIKLIGMRRLMLLGGMFSMGCFVAFSFCNRLYTFYFVAGAMGLMSTACTNMAAAILVNLWFPEKNGFYMGIVTAGTGLGGGILSIILPPFLRLFGWRAGYLLLAGIWGVLILLAAFLSGSRSDESKCEAPPEEQYSQSISFAQEGATFSQIIRSSSLYCFIFGVFILFLGSSFAQHMPAFFEEMGASDILSGIIVSVFNFSFMIFKVMEGILFDKIAPHKFLLIVSATYAMGFWILLDNRLLSLYVGSVFLSTGIALVAVMPPILTARLFGHKEFPYIWGIVSLANTMGKAIGTPAWGAIYDSFGSYRLGVAIFPVLIAIAYVFFLLTFRLIRNASWN